MRIDASHASERGRVSRRGSSVPPASLGLRDDDRLRLLEPNDLIIGFAARDDRLVEILRQALHLIFEHPLHNAVQLFKLGFHRLVLFDRRIVQILVLPLLLEQLLLSLLLFGLPLQFQSSILIHVHLSFLFGRRGFCG